MTLFLFGLFILVPILEIAVLIQVGSFLGTFATIALMILSAAWGASLVKSEGLSTMMNIRQKIQQGQVPDQEIAEGVLLAIAGVLLITPGFLTDLLGISLLLPLSRALIARQLLEMFKARQFHRASRQTYEGSFRTHEHTHRGTTLDGEFTRKDES